MVRADYKTGEGANVKPHRRKHPLKMTERALLEERLGAADERRAGWSPIAHQLESAPIAQ